MRLTPDDILQAEQSLNCLGDRELVLRSHAIEMIENLGVANDSFDIIDFSGNMISTLGEGFPSFPRLKSLYLGCNLISKILPGISESLPNLETLILTSNRISTVKDLNLEELSKLQKLKVLSLVQNPVMDLPNIREMLLKHIPTLTVLNFTKVKEAERKTAIKARKGLNLGKRPRPGMNASETKGKENGNKRVKAFVIGQGDEGADDKTNTENKHSQPTKIVVLSTEEKEAIAKMIEDAKSVEEVVQLQNAIRDGTIRNFLKTSLIQETKEVTVAKAQ